MKAPYDPCQHGFEAKVWECFRRNSKLRKDLETSCEPEEDPKIHIGGWDNPFADSFLGMCESAAKGRSLLDCTWNRLKANQRERLSDSLKPKKLKPIDSVESEDAWLELRMTMSTHSLIAVPDTVLDTEHKKRLIADFSERLPRPLADARWTKPSGRLLGRREQWKAFLAFESWQYLGAKTQEAIDLSAREINGQLPPDQSITQRRELARKHSLRKESRHKRYAKVLDHVMAIQRSIESVYPDLRPHSATGQST